MNRNARLPILLLAAAGFTILTTEFSIVGLLPAMARELRVTVAQAGLLVTLFAFTVAAFGPVLTALAGRLERKRLFVTTLIVFGFANVLAALAPNIGVMGIARFIPALILPVFWSLASETAVRITGPEQAGRAISMVTFGIVAATVFGIPIATLISDALGWRWAFATLALLSFAKAGALQAWMPQVAPPDSQASLKGQFGILRQPLVVGHVVLSVLVFAGMFTAYTYLADILEQKAGMNGTTVGWTLMGFGAVGMIGNWLGGRAADRSPLGATVAFTGAMAVGLALLIPAVQSFALLALVLAGWGIAQSALFVVSHTRVMKAAPENAAFGASLNISGANLGIGLGAMIGSRVITGSGLSSVPPFAAGLVLVATLLAVGLMRVKPASTPEFVLEPEETAVPELVGAEA